MALPKSLARFNRFVTNPIARLVAGRLPGFAIVRHRGRRSGTSYSTPINIFKVDRGFVVGLTYGSDVDWLKNVRAAGGCTVRYRNRDIELSSPATIPTAEGMRLMPPPVRAILRANEVSEFVRFRDQDGVSED